MNRRLCGLWWAVALIGVALVASPAAAEDEVSSTLRASVGLKGGIGAVAGYGFQNTESVTDDQGVRLPPGNTSWGYPEYYGHFGMGINAGLAAEIRYRGLLGLEVGYHYAQDNASGYVDKNFARTGETIARIHSDQTTTSHRVPILAKLSLPAPFVRPYLGVGLELVFQQSSELEYTQEERAGTFGTPQDMEDLNRRNDIEPSNYPLLAGALGLELAFGSIKIPMELRVGYALGYDRAMEERARGEDGRIIYDGRYMGHFAVFTGIMYEFHLLD